MKVGWCFVRIAAACAALAVAGAGRVVMGETPNSLFTVFHHRIEPEVGKLGVLELGKLVFSFAREPRVDVSDEGPVGAETLHRRIYFFPGVRAVNHECTRMLAALAHSRGSCYKLTCDPVEYPVAGLRCIVSYDREKVGLMHTTMESCKENKRLVIMVYNRTLIDTSRTKHEPILHVAFRPGVIIDCGHGGSDGGASGLLNLKEKNLNLEIGTSVAAMLHGYGYNVYLTRGLDVNVALDGRTRIDAHNKYASIFVSIHTNAALNEQARGIETFFFDVANHCTGVDKRSHAARTLMNGRCAKSQFLAWSIHKNVLGLARTRQKDIPDRGVKQAFFQVLVGSPLPAALVELGFLTNHAEAFFINDHQYRVVLAAGICQGIVEYFRHVRTSC